MARAYLYSNNMMGLEGKKQLPRVLLQIKKRYSSIFFSKLVLYGEEEASVGFIRHYDIECEAATNMADILSTKVKAIKFKAFHEIKNHSPAQQYERRTSFSKISMNYGQPKTAFAKTSRDSERNYERGYGSSATLHHSPSEYYSRVKPSHLTPIVNRKEDIKSQISEIDYSMQALMDRVKSLNQKFGKKKQDDQKSQRLQMSKVQKRQLILQKLNKLQNDFESFLSQENSVRYETASNISRNPYQSEYQGYSRMNKPHTATSYYERDARYSRNW